MEMQVNRSQTFIYMIVSIIEFFLKWLVNFCSGICQKKKLKIILYGPVKCHIGLLAIAVSVCVFCLGKFREGLMEEVVI